MYYNTRACRAETIARYRERRRITFAFDAIRDVIGGTRGEGGQYDKNKTEQKDREDVHGNTKTIPRVSGT